MAPQARPTLIGTLLRITVIVLVATVLANEAFQYAAAWTRIYLASQDARAELGSSIVASPNDRAAAAVRAQAACVQRDVALVAYGHVVSGSEPGQVVDTRMDLTSVAKNSIIAPMITALIEDGSLKSWKAHMPVVGYTYLKRFHTL